MKVRIEQDTDAQSPAEFDDCVFLVADHRQFFVPLDPKDRHVDIPGVIEEHKATHHVFLLEAYIHSGVVLALAGEGNFPDRQWDVSTLGAVFVPKSEKRLRASARKLAEGKVDEWNQYLSGDVWGVIVETDEGQHVDSCWGFYGREYAEEEAGRMLAYAEKHGATEACLI